MLSGSLTDCTLQANETTSVFKAKRVRFRFFSASGPEHPATQLFKTQALVTTSIGSHAGDGGDPKVGSYAKG